VNLLSCLQHSENRVRGNQRDRRPELCRWFICGASWRRFGRGGARQPARAAWTETVRPDAVGRVL